MIVYGSGIGDGNRHNHDDLPILLAGGGRHDPGAAGTSSSRARRRSENLFPSLLERMGVPDARFGDSTGRLSDLG